ncbi:MAG: hypothetical protein FJ134_10005 [Deltaproteobacteria bacterium]|nr:hypothetical protein [Deltaproteobacteria bacterium]
MEAIGLQRSWENLGLQSLFAPVCSLAIIRPSGEIPLRKKKALEGLERLLSKAENGLDLITQQGGYALGPLNESVNAERAFRFLKRALSNNPEVAKKELQDMKQVISHLRKNEPCSQEELVKLQEFCSRVLANLDREYFDYLSNPQNLWP